MPEETRFITNPRMAAIQVLFEPWSGLHELQPGETLRVVGNSARQGTLEVVETEELVTVYGWPGSTLQVFRGDELVDDFSLPFPEMPSGMSVRQFTEFMFGGPPKKHSP